MTHAEHNADPKRADQVVYSRYIDGSLYTIWTMVFPCGCVVTVKVTRDDHPDDRDHHPVELEQGSVCSREVAEFCREVSGICSRIAAGRVIRNALNPHEKAPDKALLN